MSSELEIRELVKYLSTYDTDYYLLHCNSTYPAPFADINLRWIPTLKMLHPFVGYSGHERGTSVSLAAVAPVLKL